MGRPAKTHPSLTALPMLPHEQLYVGVDIGKHKHVAGFLSRTLLTRHERFEGCPTLAFAQSREGFRALVDRMRKYVPLENAMVLLEHTGHYHWALEQYLSELDVTVYRIHVQERPKGMLKSDKQDALSLANTLYSQLELGVQVADKMQLVRRAVPPTKAAAQLKGLIRHRYELGHQCTSLRNKLTAINDELFPEFIQIFRDPNRETALAFRAKYPTPHTLATASLAALRKLRPKSFPSEAQLLKLRELAKQTIGTKDVDRQRSLIIEQELLIKELRLVLEHMDRLQIEITDIVTNCREGQIVLSIEPIGPLQAATIIATIGHIDNFSKASELKSYFGWAPRRTQSGATFDRTKLTTRGVRPVKYMLFLIAERAISLDCEWTHIYNRLLPRISIYDERLRDYRGKMKVIGRIAGQITTMIFALLKTDQEALNKLLPGEEPPPPMLYNSEVHRRHQDGHYRSLKPRTLPRTIIQLPKEGVIAWIPHHTVSHRSVVVCRLANPQVVTGAESHSPTE
jgi:transposase